MTKFITDGMLGKLTRWLRLAGQNVICVNDFSLPPEEEDNFLLEKAEGESGVLITRDLNLHRRGLKKGIDTILLKDEGDVPKQLAKISKSVKGKIEINMGDSRCPVCNGELTQVDKSSIDDEVPETVLEKNERFWKCGDCGKIYWPGSHWKKIKKTIEKYEHLKS